ncbi:MAG: adenylate/guanylate cyclase domain-containing protein [Candidatus Gracilibacteria bacterium]|jgi:adenylate cyclase
MKARLKKLILTVCVSLILAIFASALSVFAVPQALQERFQKHLFVGREISDDILVVYIDDYSLSDNGLGRWQDWSRKYYAQVIDNLADAGAQVIGIDILFSAKSSGVSEDDLFSIIDSSDPELQLNQYVSDEHPDDVALAESVENAGNVFLIKIPARDDQGNVVYELGSIDLIANGEAGYGYTSAGFSESDMIFKFDSYKTFAEAIAEYFNGSDFDIISSDSESFYVNYAGPAYSYESLSFYNIYSGNFDKESVEGKIVLIGTGAPSLHDRYTTPIGDETMYGVEIHANAIQTILDGAYLVDASASVRIATIFAIVFLAVFAFMYLNLWGTFGAFVVMVFGYCVSAKIAFGRGVILDLIYPFVAIVVAYIAVIAIRYFTEVQDKKRVRGAFSHYVAKEVVDEILKTPDALKLGGDKKEITILFADIKNFTNWSESTTPQELSEQLNEYFSAMSEVVMRNRGTVDKFIGDAIMAFWGAPLPLLDHAEMACRAAFEAREKLRELNAKWVACGKHELHFRVGINTGEAIVGNLGSQERFDYTAIGDNVNLASRLEGVNKFYDTEIMISENTYQVIADKFEVRKLDLIRVKGKDNAIGIYEVLGEKGSLSPDAVQIVAKFGRAYDLYFKGDFTSAKNAFEELVKKVPNDGPSGVYLKRISDLIANPPAKWDGVWEFEGK